MEVLASLFFLLLTFYALARIVDVFFIEALELISKRLKLSSDIAGATFMAMGSSAPELFVSFFAVIRSAAGEQAIGAGTIVGSAIFNILVIVGASALFRRAYLTWQPVVRDLSFYIITILLLLLTFSDGKITLTDSVLFVGMYVIYIFSFGIWKKMFPYTTKGDIDSELLESSGSEHDHIKDQTWSLKTLIDKALSLVFFDLRKKPQLVFANFGIAVVMLALLSHFMVESAVDIAHYFKVPEVIIGLTILAAGTSIPDLLSSILVAKKGQGDMAVSNAVGSNIFDINIGLGLPWFVIILVRGDTIAVVTENLSSSITLLFATVVALLFLLIARKWEIGRYAGVLLIAGYLYYLFSQMGILSTEICINLFGHHCFIL